MSRYVSFSDVWSCYGMPEIKASRLAESVRPQQAQDGRGGCFSANFGVERESVSLLAEDDSFPKDGDLTIGHPEFDHVVVMKKLGGERSSPRSRRSPRKARTGKTELSGGGQRVAMKHGRAPPVGQREGAGRRMELSRSDSANTAS